ncbi:MAG: hypothetical protein AB1847_20735 [bacterium]
MTGWGIVSGEPGVPGDAAHARRAQCVRRGDSVSGELGVSGGDA